MKSMWLPLALFVFAATITVQVLGQTDDAIEGVVKAAPVSADAAPTDSPNFKHRTLPVVNLSDDEVEAYEKNPNHKPKLDYKPKGKKSQPKSAGVSYLKASSQIIGGTRAVQKQYPWQIFMVVDNAWLCGGSVIAASWVLTAAHCVFGGSNFVVSVGGVDRTTTETSEVVVTSTVATRHENYNDNTLVNDIAVIKLPVALALNLYVNVVRLPKTSDASKTFSSTAVTATGYGKTSNTGSASSFMMTVGLTVTTNSNCARVFGTTTVIASTICTAASSSKSICSGDSGGPLVYKEADGKFTQIGVVSFGAAASCTNYPAGFARVTSFLGWISSKTGLAFRA